MVLSQFFEKLGPYPLKEIIKIINCTKDYSHIEDFEIHGVESLINAKKTNKIETNTKCQGCLGNGYLQNVKQICSGCKGSKMIVQTMQMGPMIQQSRRPCHLCNQKGYTIIPGYECKSCNSMGTTKVSES